MKSCDQDVMKVVIGMSKGAESKVSTHNTRTSHFEYFGPMVLAPNTSFVQLSLYHG